MADEKLDWELKFDDLMSGPLGKINERLDAFDRALGKIKDSDFDKALGNKAKSAEDKVAQALGGAKAKLLDAKADFAKAWQALLETPLAKRAGGLASRAGDWMRNAFSSIRGRAGSAFDFLGGVGSSISAKVAPILGKAKAAIAPVLSRVGGLFAPLATRAQAAWSKMSAGLAGFGRSAMTVLGPLGSGFAKLLGSVGSLGSAIGSKLGPGLAALGKLGMGAAGVLAAAAAAMGTAAGAIALAAGKWAMSGLQFKEDTLVSFKTMLGTQDAADRVFKQATKFAATTPFSSEEVVGGFQRFLTAGFKEDQLDTLMKAVGDVGANMGTQKMDQVITAMSQIKAKGKLQGEEMMQLAEAGVGQTAVFDALAKTLGISKAEAQARVTGGRVTGEQGIAAILEAIKTTQSGGALGSAMEGKSKTITGLLSALMDIPSTLLFESDMDKVTEPIKNALKSVIDAFNEGEPLFKKGVAAFNRIGAAWGRVFGSLGGTDIQGVLGKGIDMVEQFFVALAPFAEGFFPEMVKQLGLIFDAFTQGGKASPAELAQMGQNLAKVLGLLGRAIAFVLNSAMFQLEKWAKYADVVMSLLPGNEQEDSNSELRNTLGMPKTEMGASAVATNGGVTNHNTASIGQIVVQVSPDEADAGARIATGIQSGGLLDQFTRFATEMAG